MPKRTAIIDIGSNSGRLVIFEKTSRYGFHLICEQKAKVRMGEGAYEKDGNLQPTAIKRAFLTLQSFRHTIEKFQAHKVICVATSALRDAPNGNSFVQWIKKELDLDIEIIDGNKEATYGAIAAKNLLPFQNGITIDIGGGSSDMAYIENGTIVATYSLNLGTVRLKELFSDQDLSRKEIVKRSKAYIDHVLTQLPPQFKHSLAIGIGGTARSLSKGIMKQSGHPLDKLHAFSYEIDAFHDYLHAIPLSSAKALKQFHLKKNRFDTIREGTLIFNAILSAIGAKELMTSGVGVREGVYLEQALQQDELSYPQGINPSITSILDRFKPYVTIEKRKKNTLGVASSLYHTLQPEINDHLQYKRELSAALQLSSIGNTLTIYKSHQTAFYIAMQELNYGYTHKEMILISMLLRMHGKSLLHKPLFESFKTLLPPKKALLWLSFIYTLTLFIAEASNDADIHFHYQNKTLVITSDKSLYLARENIKSLEKPASFAIIINDEEGLPGNKVLGIL